jgi:hypothetical protein
MVVRSFQASSMYLRKLASAFGAGSVATTSKPRARYWAAQLADHSRADDSNAMNRFVGSHAGAYASTGPTFIGLCSQSKTCVLGHGRSETWPRSVRLLKFGPLADLPSPAPHRWEKRTLVRTYARWLAPLGIQSRVQVSG